MSAVDEIKQKLDIVEYIGQFVTLKKVGRNFHALCPFHSEKSPSFVVSPERQLWHCFGACGEGGDVIKFVMKWESCTFGEALHILAPLANVKLDETVVNDQAWDDRLHLLQVTTLAADFFHYIFTKHRIGEAARTYITSRQISSSTIKAFRIGYAPDSWDSLSKFLRAKKITNDAVVKTGLGTLGKNHSVYDRFRGRIMFPLTDTRGSILGFSGRVLSATDKEAKYINTPETTIYHKRETLFGIEQAVRAIRTKEEVIIMEGEFDVMLAHQFGYTQSVGIKGTALTIEQIHLLKRLTHTFIFCLDMDKAGTEAIKRGIERSQEYDLSLYVMRLSGGKDPADLLTSDPAAFKRAYKEKVSIYDFLLETSVARHDVSTVYGQKEVIDELAPVITTITNPVVYEFFIKKTAAATGTDTATLKDAIRLYKRTQRKKTIAPKPTPQALNEHMVEDFVIALIVQSPQPAETIQHALGYLDNNSFTQPATGELIQELRTYLSHHESLPAGDDYITNPSLRPLFNRAFLIRVPLEPARIKAELHKIALILKKQMLHKRIQASPSPEETNKLVNALRSVEKELSVV